VLVQARNAQEEADLLADRIAAALASGTPPDDVAVLYRAKALMRPSSRRWRGGAYRCSR